MANGTVGAPASLRVVERRGWRWSNAGQGRAGLGEHRDREWDGVCIGGVARHDKENREHEWCTRSRKVVHHHMPISSEHSAHQAIVISFLLVIFKSPYVIHCLIHFACVLLYDSLFQIVEPIARMGILSFGVKLIQLSVSREVSIR